jgi:diguanylate cyclase (GGDEF)-like protein
VIMARLRFRPTRLIVATLVRTLGADLRALLAWLALCALLGVGVWVWTFSVIARDKQHIREKLHTSAAATARAYAEQLERSLSQIDYIMLSQKYHWEKGGGAMNFEEQKQAGLVPPASELIVTIVDVAGDPVTSTLPFPNSRTNIAQRKYFKAHQQHPDLGLTITRPRIGVRLGRAVILLARRLNDSKAQFAGMIVVAIEPVYFTARLGAGALEPDDLVAAYRADGKLLAGSPKPADIALGARTDTSTGLSGNAGTAQVSADRYRDGKARVLAWYKVAGYPLFAAVALSEQSRLNAFGARESEMRVAALFASLALLLAAAGGTACLVWNASKKRHREQASAALRATESAQERRLAQGANIDALTSLPNRFWLMKHLPAALDAARSAGATLAVLFIDLDDFRLLNDTQGHAAGDHLLRTCARRLRGVLRQGDELARLGGDEFTMILRAPGGDAQIAAVARRVIDELGEAFAIGDGQHVVSASVGISVFPRDGDDGAALLKHADSAMCDAKQRGKSQYCFFHSPVP